MLDEGEGLLLIEEDLAGDLLGGDIPEEDDDAIVGGMRGDVEPHVERLGVVLLEFGGYALLHGAVKLSEESARTGVGKLFPDVPADEIAFHGEDLFGAAVQEGKGPIATDADYAVQGGCEDLLKLVGGGVATGLGFFAGGDVAGEDDDAIFKGTDEDFEPDVEWRGVEGLELGGDAALHGGAIV